MDRIDAMRVFTRVLELRSFTLAATDLNLPRSTVTEAVKKIESKLGVRLLERTTRQVTPTLDGEHFYHRCIAIINDVEDAESTFSGHQPKGQLRVDVHGSLARHFLLPKLPEFLAQYPDIEVFMSEGDQLVDLVREGIDCVLRVGKLKAEDLVAKEITQLIEVTVAAPSYLAKHGTPKNIEELTQHVMVGFKASGHSKPMPLEFTHNKQIIELSVPTSMTVNSAETFVAAAKLGLGIIQVPKYHIEKELAKGELVTILADTPPLPSPVSLLYPRNRSHSPRVKAFIEWLKDLDLNQ